MHLVAELEARKDTNAQPLWRMLVDAGPATDSLAVYVHMAEVGVRLEARAEGTIAVVVRQREGREVEVWRIDSVHTGYRLDHAQ